MKINQLRGIAAVGVLWLCLGVGCRKDPPEPKSCNDGTCCMQDTRDYDYVEYLENAPADLGGPPFFSAWGVGLKNPIPTTSQFPARGAQVCDLTLSKVVNLRQTATKDGVAGSYHYRIWGKVYGDRSQTLVAIPIMYIYIDRIEEAK